LVDGTPTWKKIIVEDEFCQAATVDRGGSPDLLKGQAVGIMAVLKQAGHDFAFELHQPLQERQGRSSSTA